MNRKLAIRPAIGTGSILLVPLVMSILDRYKSAGDGWHWKPSDFIVAGILIFYAGLSYELLARKLDKTAHRLVLGLLVFCVLAAIWVELAVDGITQLVTGIVG